MTFTETVFVDLWGPNYTRVRIILSQRKHPIFHTKRGRTGSDATRNLTFGCHCRQWSGTANSRSSLKERTLVHRARMRIECSASTAASSVHCAVSVRSILPGHVCSPLYPTQSVASQSGLSSDGSLHWRLALPLRARDDVSHLKMVPMTARRADEFLARVAEAHVADTHDHAHRRCKDQHSAGVVPKSRLTPNSA